MEDHPAVKAPTSDVVVLDAFLEPELHEALLAHALAQSGSTEPTRVYGGGARTVDPTSRVADLCTHGLGALAGPFVERIMARFEAIVGALGIRPFPVAEAQLEMVAHNDGAMFSRHIDTLTEENRPFGASDRIVSLVYYFHRQPKAFSGGELEVFPILGGTSTLIEPLDNRLIAFPSELPHEVLPVSCPSRAFEDSRFAVNVWLGRPRKRT